MSDTPRTDEAEKKFTEWHSYLASHQFLSLDQIKEKAPPEADPFLIARILERELKARPQVLPGPLTVFNQSFGPSKGLETSVVWVLDEGTPLSVVQEFIDRQQKRIFDQAKGLDRLRDKLARLRAGAEFWNGIHPDGVSAENLADELSDYHALLQSMPEFVNLATGGVASNPMIDLGQLRALLDDHVDRVVADATLPLQRRIKELEGMVVTGLMASEYQAVVYNQGLVEGADLEDDEIVVTAEHCEGLAKKIADLQDVIKEGRISKCAFCGEETVGELRRDQILNHMAACKEHPYRALLLRLTRLEETKQ